MMSTKIQPKNLRLKTVGVLLATLASCLLHAQAQTLVSYTHLTLPTNREV